jgi:hypothetical protein
MFFTTSEKRPARRRHTVPTAARAVEVTVENNMAIATTSSRDR